MYVCVCVSIKCIWAESFIDEISLNANECLIKIFWEVVLPFSQFWVLSYFWRHFLKKFIQIIENAFWVLKLFSCVKSRVIFKYHAYTCYLVMCHFYINIYVRVCLCVRLSSDRTLQRFHVYVYFELGPTCAC